MAEGISGIIVIFAVVFVVVWLLLPFLIIGVNNRLDKLLKRTYDMEDLLKDRKEKQ